jgi:hypothetical protein
MARRLCTRRLMQTLRSLGGKQLLLRSFLGGKKLLLLREFLEMQVSWMSIGEYGHSGQLAFCLSPANLGGHVEGYRPVVAACAGRQVGTIMRSRAGRSGMGGCAGRVPG